MSQGSSVMCSTQQSQWRKWQSTVSQRNAGHVVASHPGQTPDRRPVLWFLLTAAFDSVIVTMISFSPSLSLLSRSFVLSPFLSDWLSAGRGGGAQFISFQFILNLLIPCWFCWAEGHLRGWGAISFDTHTPFSPSAYNVCTKINEWGLGKGGWWKGAKEPRRREGREEGVTTAA